MVKISVVVATYKRPASLARCLASLRAQTRPADEIIVVGQGEDRDARRVVADVRSGARGLTPWVYVHLPAPGIVAAENTAVAQARGDVVAFIDDDATAPRTWLAVMEGWYVDPKVGGVGGPYIEHDRGAPVIAWARRVGTFRWFGRYESRQWCLTERSQTADVLAGSNMSFRKALFPRLPAEIRPYWHAFEVFASLAVRRQGYTIIYDPALAVDHFRDENGRHYALGSGTTAEISRLLYANNAHNFTLAALRYRPGIHKFLFLGYDFLVGDRGRPGLARAAALWLAGRGREARAKLGPSLGGRAAGVRTFLRTRTHSLEHGPLEQPAEIIKVFPQFRNLAAPGLRPAWNAPA